MLLFYIFILSFLLINGREIDHNIDENGYILFCPCMGRFGNQADQFLGALAFAHELKRTLILPHWVEYPEAHPSSVQIAFDKYFQVSPLQEYTNVILMEDFMKYLAPKVWPIGKRTIFCYASRSNTKQSCDAKEGNPFGPYWDKFGIDFDNNVFYGPLSYDTNFADNQNNWKIKYSSKIYPVLAFTGAPGAFPVEERNVHLHKYLKWSDDIESKAMQFLKRANKKNEKIIGIHLRNGADFKRACEHINENQPMNFFASAQCIGYHMEHGKLTREICYPSDKTVINQLKEAIIKHEAKYVYVASDAQHMIQTFEKKIPNVKFIKYDGNIPHVDLCILGKVDHAILNCVSSFSAFVKRERDSNNKSSEFWAFKQTQHEEL